MIVNICRVICQKRNGSVHLLSEVSLFWALSGWGRLRLWRNLYPPFQQIPIKLQASKVLPKDLLRGDNFTVNENLENDGFVNIYTLETNDGELRVESTFNDHS